MATSGKYKNGVTILLTDLQSAVLDISAEKTNSTKGQIIRTALLNLVKFPMNEKELEIKEILFNQNKSGGLIWLPPRTSQATIYEKDTKRLIQRAKYIIEAPPEIGLPVYISGNHFEGWIIRFYKDRSAACTTIFRDLEKAREEAETFNPLHHRNILGAEIDEE